ncbi:MAG: hypothetical protein ACJ73C_07500, partial [Nitrososphaeraceae archaeon]
SEKNSRQKIHYHHTLYRGLLIRIQRAWVAHSFDDYYQRKEFYRQAVLNVSLWTNVIAETDVDVDII